MHKKFHVTQGLSAAIDIPKVSVGSLRKFRPNHNPSKLKPKQRVELEKNTPEENKILAEWNKFYSERYSTKQVMVRILPYVVIFFVWAFTITAYVAFVILLDPSSS